MSVMGMRLSDSDTLNLLLLVIWAKLDLAGEVGKPGFYLAEVRSELTRHIIALRLKTRNQLSLMRDECCGNATKVMGSWSGRLFPWNADDRTLAGMPAPGDWREESCCVITPAEVADLSYMRLTHTSHNVRRSHAGADQPCAQRGAAYGRVMITVV